MAAKQTNSEPHDKGNPAKGSGKQRSAANLLPTGQVSVNDLPVDALCQDFHMRIGRDGTWYYQGTPINRKPLVKLFSTVLRRESDGKFWLVTPVERGTIEVEDAPFTAVEVRQDGDKIVFLTNLDHEVTLGADHPLRIEIDPETAEPRPYIMIRDGLEALILRPVFYHLVEMAEEIESDGNTKFGVWSDGRYFELGTVKDGE